jgi:hypothetical protein
MKITPTSRIALCPGVHARRFDNEVVVLDLARGVYFGLDDVGAAIWEGFQKGQSPQDIARDLIDTYAVEQDVLVADACDLARRLIEAGLVVVDGTK